MESPDERVSRDLGMYMGKLERRKGCDTNRLQYSLLFTTMVSYFPYLQNNLRGNQNGIGMIQL